LGCRNKICIAHFRNVSCTAPQCQETLFDSGDVDLLKAMRLFGESGFDGPFVDDHVPEMVGDSNRQKQAAAFTHG